MVRYSFLNQLGAVPWIPKWLESMANRMSWSMVSNAADKSRITVDVIF